MQSKSFAKQVFEVYATQTFTSFALCWLIDTEAVLIILSYNMIFCDDVTTSICHLDTLAKVWSLRAAGIFWVFMSAEEMSHRDRLLRIKSKAILKFWVDPTWRDHH